MTCLKIKVRLYTQPLEHGNQEKTDYIYMHTKFPLLFWTRQYSQFDTGHGNGDLGNIFWLKQREKYTYFSSYQPVFGRITMLTFCIITLLKSSAVHLHVNRNISNILIFISHENSLVGILSFSE